MSRIYSNFTEAIPEIKRDVVEMGVKCAPHTYQDKNVKDNPDFETLELQNYLYTVVNPDRFDLKPSQPWARWEWGERAEGIEGHPINPGEAWRFRPEVWSEFLKKNGRFAYTYSERFARNNQVRRVIKRIKEDPESRQLFISIWSASDTSKLGGISRVPCSLGYLFQCRKGALNITYLQRSCDLITHFVNDVYLACCLQEYISREVQIKLGNFTHWIGSLHLFKRDGEGVF